MQTLPVCTAILAASDQSVNFTSPFLSDVSPREKPWDQHKSEADYVAAIYAQEQEFQRLFCRMIDCSGRLGFKKVFSSDGTSSYKLVSARFCRVRHCPVCQWRRSLMYYARSLKRFPSLQRDYPTSRYLFLTLTQRNVPIGDLKKTLRLMTKAWNQSFRKRKQFACVQGWLRTTEVTRGSDGSAHPHFHVLLMVPSGYFSKKTLYLTKPAWAQLWKDALGIDYSPVVDIRRVPKGDVVSSLREVLKYSVKPSDMTADPDWFLELTRQLHKSRFIASGGVLKDVLKESEETDEQLMLLGDSEDDELAKEPTFFADWDRPVQRYKLSSSDNSLLLSSSVKS